MSKAIVRHGDPTTTGGFVIALSSTIFDDGKRIALHGDEATCGGCKGVFKIFGSGTEATENGRATVLHGDPVMCPCGRNKVFVVSDPGCHVESGSGAAPASNAVAAGASTFSSFATGTFDEQVRAAAPGVVLNGYPYFIETADGRTFSGSVGASGKLPRIDTDGADEYTVFWGDDAIERQEGAETCRTERQ
jgi:uncharacterized Zn-binding protein involved in type VI secretion